MTLENLVKLSYPAPDPLQPNLSAREWPPISARASSSPAATEQVVDAKPFPEQLYLLLLRKYHGTQEEIRPTRELPGIFYRQAAIPAEACLTRP